MQCLSLYLDEPCGWRRYYVVQTGRKWARLVNAEDASTYRVPLSVLEKGRPVAIKPTRAARRLRAVARCYGQDGNALVKEAVSLLSRPAPCSPPIPAPGP